MAIRILALAMSASFLLASAAGAEARPAKPSLIAACLPDVKHYCLTWPWRIRACMIRHRDQLTDKCREAGAASERERLASSKSHEPVAIAAPSEREADPGAALPGS